MAELTGQSPRPDMVTCACGKQSDRNVYAQWPDCSANLWELSRAMVAPPADRSDTVMESEPRAHAHIDILVCGRRLMIGEGQTVRLGREDGLDTEEVFHDVMNVSRHHAEL